MSAARQAVLFDMDGVLRNTEPLHRAVYARFANELSGGSGLEHNISGKSTLGIYQALTKRFGNACGSAEELFHRHFELVYQGLTEQGIGPMEGLDTLLSGLASRGISYGVISSSPRWFVERNLCDVGIQLEAVCVVTGTDGLPLKPAPDLYLAGIRAFGESVDLLAVEDSASGLAAAKAALLPCAVLHNPDSGAHELSSADWHLTQLPELLTVLDQRRAN